MCSITALGDRAYLLSISLSIEINYIRKLLKDISDHVWRETIQVYHLRSNLEILAEDTEIKCGHADE